MPEVVIAGLGVSGLGCALQLARRGVPFLALEKESRPGGLARSEPAGEFRFDYGPHILLNLPPGFPKLPGLELAECSGKSGIVLDEGLRRVIPAPFQKHLGYLPGRLRARLLLGLLRDRALVRRQPAS